MVVSHSDHDLILILLLSASFALSVARFRKVAPVREKLTARNRTHNDGEAANYSHLAIRFSLISVLSTVWYPGLCAMQIRPISSGML
jgi:hypothetical protein